MYTSRFVGLAFGMLAAIICCSSVASASVIRDLPIGLADALDTTTMVAGLILASAILVSLGLALAVAKMDIIGIFAVMLPVLVLLIVFDWIPDWILILVIMIIAAMFGSRMAEWWTARRAGGG